MEDVVRVIVIVCVFMCEVNKEVWKGRNEFRIFRKYIIDNYELWLLF